MSGFSEDTTYTPTSDLDRITRSFSIRSTIWIFLVGALLLLLTLFLASREVEDGITDAHEAGPALEASRPLVQRFRAKADGLVHFELLLANYEQEADGELEVSLFEVAKSTNGRIESAHDDPTNRHLVQTWTLPAAEVENNAWRRFDLNADAAPPRLGQALELEIKREKAGGQPVTAWTSGGDLWPDADLRFDGQPQRGDLCLRLVYAPGPWQGAGLELQAFGRPVWQTLILIYGLFVSALAFLYHTSPKA